MNDKNRPFRNDVKWFEKLKFARKIAGLKLREVSAKTGISNGYVAMIENGRIKDPSYFKIRKLLMVYNLDHDDIETTSSDLRTEP